ncbi:MAG: TlpA family protein disulfide reductase [Pirellulaceae bacterium]|nr:TlpA family protein disulfide reductase [Pirellulaceae bacterium]
MSSSQPHAPPSSNALLYIFGAFMLVGITFMVWMGQPPAVVTVGQPLPQLDLHPLLDGTEPISREQLQGKLTVIHFWGTWCPPCEAEFPEFAKLAAKFLGNPEVAIVSVSCSSGPEYDLDQLRSLTEKFMSNYDTPIPTYSDPTAMTRQQLALILPNGSLGYPTTLLVDRDGKILELLEGYLPGDMEKLSLSIERRL